MRSVRLRELDARLTLLRNRYLPRNFSPTGNYTNEVYLDTAAFLLLCHAELETYFEQVIFEKVDSLLIAVGAGRSTKSMQSVLCVLFNQNVTAAPGHTSEFRVDPYASRTLQSAAHAVRIRAEGNQGIKVGSILPMMIALGLDETRVDHDLLKSMDELRRKRGAVAHHAVHDLPILPDPKEARTLVYDILARLKDFEKLLP